MWTTGLLTVDDTTFVGKRERQFEPVLNNYLESKGYTISDNQVVPADQKEIKSVLTQWIYQKRLKLITVSGGTGLSPMDVTPEAMLEILDRRLPGMEEGLRNGLRENQVEAMLFQGVVGIAGNSLIITLPLSPETSKQCLIKIEPAIKGALMQISHEGLQSG